MLVGASNQLSPAKRTKISNSDSNDSLNLLSTLSMDQSGQAVVTATAVPSHIPKHPAGSSSHSVTSIASPSVKPELPPLHSRPTQRTPVMQPISLPSAAETVKTENIPAIERNVSAESDLSDISNTTQISKMSTQQQQQQQHEKTDKSAAQLLNLASAVDMVE